MADRCFVLTVVILITFCFISYWFLVAVPLAFWTSVIGWINLLLFHSCVALLVIAYYKTMTVSPGLADKNYVRTDVLSRLRFKRAILASCYLTTVDVCLDCPAQETKAQG